MVEETARAHAPHNPHVAYRRACVRAAGERHRAALGPRWRGTHSCARSARGSDGGSQRREEVDERIAQERFGDGGVGSVWPAAWLGHRCSAARTTYRRCTDALRGGAARIRGTLRRAVLQARIALRRAALRRSALRWPHAAASSAAATVTASACAASTHSLIRATAVEPHELPAAASPIETLPIVCEALARSTATMPGGCGL
jgi:hypothetical protein